MVNDNADNAPTWVAGTRLGQNLGEERRCTLDRQGTEECRPVVAYRIRRPRHPRIITTECSPVRSNPSRSKVVARGALGSEADPD